MKWLRQNSDFLTDLVYAVDHRLLRHDVESAALSLTRFGLDDDVVRSLVQPSVHRHRFEQLLSVPFSIPHLNHGDLVLGVDQKDNEIRVLSRCLNAHSITVGGSGSGKTTKSRFLASQVAPIVKGLWLTDCEKREFARLRPALSRLGIELLIVPARALRLNPLQYQKPISPMDWAARISDILVQALQLPPRATKVLHMAILTLYRDFNVL